MLLVGHQLRIINQLSFVLAAIHCACCAIGTNN